MSDDEEFPANPFLDLLAEVANGSELTDDDDKADSEDREFLDDSDVHANCQAQPSALPRHVSGTQAAEADVVEAIARGIHERARNRTRVGPTPHNDGGLDDGQRVFRGQWSHLPKRAKVDVFEELNYRMYVVRCRNPHLEVRRARKRLPNTCLVFSIPWLHDRFYLWVPDAKVFTDYLRQLKGKHLKLQRVLEEEVNDVFAMRTGARHDLHLGAWVQVLGGEFSGDLGIVKDVSASGRKVSLAVLPRVDKPRDGGANNANLVQHHATLEWLRTTFPDEEVAELDDGGYEFRGERYEGGLRVLTLLYQQLEPVFPFFHEVAMFSLGNYGDLQDVECYVRTGDVVVISSGQFQNMAAIVKDRAGPTVLLASLRGIDLPSQREIEEGSNIGEYLQVISRAHVLELILRDPLNNLERSEATVDIKAIRRVIDVGDEVLVRVGRHAGRTGFVLSREVHNLSLQFAVDEPVDEVSRYWVETVNAGGFIVPQKNVDKEVRLCDHVLVRSGPFKGRLGTVTAISDGKMCGVLIKEPKTLFKPAKEVQIRMPQMFLHKFTYDMLETGVLPLFTSQEGKVYPKLSRSPYVGRFVTILNRDNKDFQARISKGRYGYVMSVDVERNTAQVSYDNKEVSITLKNLVLLDEQQGVKCLDPSAPLSALQKLQLQQQYSEYRASVSRYPSRRTPEAERRSRTPSPEPSVPEPDMSEVPITDFSRPGMWVFHSKVRPMYETHKVHVRVVSKNRAGFITGDMQEDHSACQGFHGGCRVLVHVDWSRAVTATVVDVADIKTARPMKKNQSCMQVKALPAGEPLLLLAKGVPRSSERPITVCTPEDERKLWDVDASCVTRIETK